MPFALVYVVSDDRSHATLCGASGLVGGGQASPVKHALAAGPWPLERALATDEVDFELEPLADALPPGPEPPRRALLLPLHFGGDEQPAGCFVAGIHPHRPLDIRHREFLSLIAAQRAASLERARAFEESRRRAEQLAELSSLKDRFLGNISHELRTPLTLILGPADELLTDGEALPAPQLELIVGMRRDAARLLRLVDDLLHFARAGAGVLRPQLWGRSWRR